MTAAPAAAAGRFIRSLPRLLIIIITRPAAAGFENPGGPRGDPPPAGSVDVPTKRAWSHRRAGLDPIGRRQAACRLARCHQAGRCPPGLDVIGQAGPTPSRSLPAGAVRLWSQPLSTATVEVLMEVRPGGSPSPQKA